MAKRDFKRRFKHDFENREEFKEKPKGKSKTVIGDTLSIRDMLTRHANGINFDNVKTPFYEEQATFSGIALNKIQDMDLTEKMEYLSEVTTKAEELRLKIDAYKKERDEREAEALEQSAQRSQEATTPNDSEAVV